jgi:hypothetical protein
VVKSKFSGKVGFNIGVDDGFGGSMIVGLLVGVLSRFVVDCKYEAVVIFRSVGIHPFIPVWGIYIVSLFVLKIVMM